ncbi:hypothetical protein [Actinomadura chokoriensis]|uniref:Uncharacterized protein n=1 Tax=Actinomadura chokoriensis TaxID=454156 RepID=A0ABV4QV08_9ACTN
MTGRLLLQLQRCQHPRAGGLPAGAFQQAGPLWDELERAYEWWLDSGEPWFEAGPPSVTAEEQTVRLDSPAPWFPVPGSITSGLLLPSNLSRDEEAVAATSSSQLLCRETGLPDEGQAGLVQFLARAWGTRDR